MKSLCVGLLVLLGGSFVLADEESSPARRGGERGNGGDVMVVRDPQTKAIQSIELLDVYEARENRKLAIDTTSIPSEGTVDEQTARWLELFLTRYEARDAHRVARLREYAAQFDRERTYQESGTLDDIPDSKHVGKPDNGSVEQIAVQPPTHFPDDPKYYVLRPLWDLLDPFNRGALIFHELLYRDLKATHADSLAVRYLVGRVISNTLDVSDPAWIDIASSTELFSYDLQGIEFQATYGAYRPRSSFWPGTQVYQSLPVVTGSTVGIPLINAVTSQADYVLSLDQSATFHPDGKLASVTYVPAGGVTPGAVRLANNDAVVWLPGLISSEDADGMRPGMGHADHRDDPFNPTTHQKLGFHADGNLAYFWPDRSEELDESRSRFTIKPAPWKWGDREWCGNFMPYWVHEVTLEVLGISKEKFQENRWATWFHPNGEMGRGCIEEGEVRMGFPIERHESKAEEIMPLASGPAGFYASGLLAFGKVGRRANDDPYSGVTWVSMARVGRFPLSVNGLIAMYPDRMPRVLPLEQEQEFRVAGTRIHVRGPVFFHPQRVPGEDKLLVKQAVLTREATRLRYRLREGGAEVIRYVNCPEGVTVQLNPMGEMVEYSGGSCWRPL